VAYDPALTAFIIVGIVGGVAVVMSAAPGWETSHELDRATDGWTVPVVSRTYRDSTSARQRRAREVAILEGHGYREVLRREVLRREVHRRELVAGPEAAEDVEDGEDRDDGGDRRGPSIVITYRLE
jgi:hypothetical protein